MNGLETPSIAAPRGARRLAHWLGGRAKALLGAAGGIRRLSAGNYGGKLGKFHFPLRALLP